MHMPRTPIAVLAVAAMAALGAADKTSLTIYSTAEPGAVPAELYRPVPGSSARGYGGAERIPGYAVVKQERTLGIEPGVSEHSFTGVAALLDPTTVLFESLSDPGGTSVLEQSYRFDLLSMSKMLERYIDKEIIIAGERVTLLSVSGGGLLVKDGGGAIRYKSGYEGVSFPEIADGLITTPTLVWMIESDTGGEQDTRLSYETKGLTWWADYNMVFHPGADANAGTIDLGAWVSILNQSGGSYEDASLKLIAGDVNRAESSRPDRREYQRMAAATARDKGFEEKSFFEYHLYTLGRPTTIPDRSTKQLELFETARGVPVEKILVYDATGRYMSGGGRHESPTYGLGSPDDVRVLLRFDNDGGDGLGIPLPAGRVRVSQTDEADGSLEFIGEDTIDHTPRNETVTITMGNAFDVVGERRQVSFQRGRDWMTETIEVKVRNQKEVPVEVRIREHLYRWTNADITDISHEPDMLDARTMMVPVTIGPEGEAVVTYTVRYSW